MLNSEIKYAVS